MYEGPLKVLDKAIARMSISIVFFLLIGVFFIPSSTSETIYQNDKVPLSIIDGQILYSPMWSTTTYLRESSGTLDHIWTSSFFPGVMTRWIGNGKILRTIRVGVGPGTGGAGGGVQIVDWDGTIVWDFRYNTNGVLSHHDVRALPNGNILLIAWETKTPQEAIAAGRNPDYISSQGFFPDHILEVQPTGPTSGTIVWEWHVWDHLIQNFDSLKQNYGVVADHPELVNVNYAASSQSDWMHTNSIDYNEEFDQILLSVHNFNEIWVIDHSTTTQQAAGHTGGRSGKGGDLLYRWGNPAAYNRGTASDQKLFLQHDANWIDPGCPGEGHILIFNNGVGRFYSTVDEIVTPVDSNGDYYLAPVSAYGPTVQIWTYNPQPSFYASIISGAQRLPNGNTLVCNGETGELFEVTPTGSKVWQYSTEGQVFKVEYLPPEEQQFDTPDLDCIGSLVWANVEAGSTVTGSFQVKNIGGQNSLLDWNINYSSMTWGTWIFNPQSGINLRPNDGFLTIQVTLTAPDQKKTDFEGFLRVENSENSSDYEVIPVSLTTSTDTHENFQRPSLLQQLIIKIQQWILRFEQLFISPFLHIN
jgi:hypothetical protein